MEGIHLRGGRVARGGIRWSDREDYRTEVLGLMKAQMVKNAVIVPVGAKGGFVLKHRRPIASELREEVVRQYSTLLRGMLDVTDNLVGGEVVHPPGVRVLDEDDPYLVVAADKGTATLSDTANAISDEYGFWLGDAFASGGSTGYDHKALGITARGAWESVKRHFRELGLDVATDPFTVVGIGDMSGDVFGNGMLLSDQIRLVAAFDHRHVFLDPDPDPAVGFAERKRLFDLAGSSWDDYDRAKISAGGGVWSRTAKSIPLSERCARARGRGRGARARRADPGDPARAGRPALERRHRHLRQGVRGDRRGGRPLPDAIRVDGRELRCRVVGEGGNLGFTQRGRIEYARAGGRINTDFIDNSAGVDCSDHEVNLKILLGARQRALARGPRRAAARRRGRRRRARALRQLPAGADPHPGDAALRHAARGVRGPDAGARGGRAARPHLEALPVGRGAGRAAARGPRDGAARAVVLLAYAKRRLKLSLLESSLPDDP